MGEAKRKSALWQRHAGALEVARSAALATAKVFRAGSAQRGRDCTAQAAIVAALLNGHGVKCEAVAGYAAWRVGSGAGDCVVHHPAYCAADPKSKADFFPGHAWVVTESGLLVDSTTWSLRDKLRELDAADGGFSICEWCPEVLVSFTWASSLAAVANASRAGFFWYHRDDSLRHVLTQPEPDYLTAARFVMQMPAAKVFGPQNMREPA